MPTHQTGKPTAYPGSTGIGIPKDGSNNQAGAPCLHWAFHTSPYLWSIATSCPSQYVTRTIWDPPVRLAYRRPLCETLSQEVDSSVRHWGPEDCQQFSSWVPFAYTGWSHAFNLCSNFQLSAHQSASPINHKMNSTNMHCSEDVVERCAAINHTHYPNTPPHQSPRIPMHERTAMHLDASTTNRTDKVCCRSPQNKNCQ